MGDKTGIEWTDATWTPIRARNVATEKLGWHCEHKSDACRNCYAESLNLRLGTKLPFKPGHLKNGDVEIFLDNGLLLQPMRWERPRMIFPCSMTDLFAEFVTDEMIAMCFAVMALTPWHFYQVLTKRPERMRALLNSAEFVQLVARCMEKLAPAHWHNRELEDVGGWPLKNVMVGSSAGDQEEATTVLQHVLSTNAHKHFLSYEPALGPLDLTIILDATGATLDTLRGKTKLPGYPHTLDSPHLDWVIAGGESGRKARPAHPEWFRSVRNQCAAAGVPFFFKQWGEWEPREEWSPHQGGGRFEPMVAVMLDGSQCPHDVVPQDVGAHRMARVGKKAAGALLDGMEHKAMPR